MTDKRDLGSARQDLSIRNWSSSPHRSPPVTERDLLHKHHRLLRHEDKDDVDRQGSVAADDESKDYVESAGHRSNDRLDRADEYGKQIAKEYYNRLVKDFPLLDLSRYKEGMVALRWRTMAEFSKNKGGPKGICAEIFCDVRDNDYTPNSGNDYDYDSNQSGDFLEKRQVLFKYLEDSEDGTRKEHKAIMVTCWLCPDHGRRLDNSHEYEKERLEAGSRRSRGSQATRLDRHVRRHRHHRHHHRHERHPDSHTDSDHRERSHRSS
ncbi:folate-sensitive fragile site protein Fra10Ac1-domain-containing protein [Lipomyces kononenkoae]|uniref:Folate-sensitive fragile site protein Fra10Ac1-domain-containing protein n=1 Tax=Lipomyces kononenkoae TaxID=34357 RepID=A0ACC3T6Z8_LIPKO